MSTFVPSSSRLSKLLHCARRGLGTRSPGDWWAGSSPVEEDWGVLV